MNKNLNQTNTCCKQIFGKTNTEFKQTSEDNKHAAQ